MLGSEESCTFRCVLRCYPAQNMLISSSNIFTIYPGTLTAYCNTGGQTDSTITKSEPRVQSLGVNHPAGHCSSTAQAKLKCALTYQRIDSAVAVHCAVLQQLLVVGSQTILNRAAHTNQ
jgi:hypothetical protein